MSFGLSSGGGQVRYAVLFDSTQAEQNVRRYQTSLQQLATGTTGVSGKMAIMNNTFTAGLTPIKNQGNALNQLSTTQKTIGSQLGGLGSAFKSNALAIGAAASSVLGLYQNYANLSSAQNAANKSATAAKAAQNSVATATKNLGKAIDQYGKGSKEAKAAQDKLTVAQERAVNKTESAKIAQDNLNQTMADFGINILPNIILAGGSIVSIFDNIGKSGSGVTGIISKLGSALGGLGGGTGLKGFFTSIITGLTGISVGGPAAGTGMKVFAGGMDTAAFSAKGLALSLGPIAALLGGAVFGNAVQLANPQLTAFSNNIDKGAVSAANALGPLGDLLKAYREFMIKTFPQFATEAAKASVGIGTLGPAVTTAIAPSKELTAAQDKLNIALKDPALKSHQTETRKAAEATVEHAKSQVALLTAAENTNPALTILGNSIKVVADNSNTAQNAGGGLMAVISGLGSEDAKLQKQTTDLNIALQSQFEIMQNAAPKNLFELLAKGGPIIQTLGDETKAADPKMKALIGTLNTGGPVMDDFLGSAKALGPPLVDAAEKAALLKKATIDVGAAMTAGKDKFSSFIKTTGEAAITNKQYEAGLRAIVAAHVELDPSINLTTSQLEEMTKSIIEGKGAALAYAEIVAKQMAPAVATFQGLLNTKNIKEFNDAFKGLELGNLEKGLGKGLRDAFKPLQQVAERSRELSNLFDALAVAGENLSSKNVGKAIKEMADGFNDIGPLAKQFGDTLLSYVKTAPNAAAAFQKINPVMQKFGELTADGSFSLEDYRGITELFNTTIGKTADPVGKSAAAIKAFGVSSASARGQIDQVTGAIDVLAGQAASIKPVIIVQNASALKAVDAIAKRIMSLTGLSPIISLVNKQAIKAVDVVAKRIDSLTGIKPQISLQNKQAIKSVDVVAKRIDSLEKLKPSISLQNKQAIKSVDVVAKRIQGLENIHPVINVKVNIPNIPNSAKGDTSTSSKGDTSGIFVGGSKSDSGGGGGGDTVINIHVMDETIMRRITARSGRGRFTMGA